MHATAPVIPTNVPDGQVVQLSAPEVGLNDPAAHNAQEADPESEYVPAGHAVHAVAVTALNVPALHATHPKVPPVEYVPAEQAV